MVCVTGMTFGQLSKYTSSMYAALTPEDKGMWQGRASKDKSRYLMEMATYIPSAAYDAKGDRIGGHSLPYEGPQKSSARDPNAPKRNLSTYLLYQNAMRETFKAENPGEMFFTETHFFVYIHIISNFFCLKRYPSVISPN